MAAGLETRTPTEGREFVESVNPRLQFAFALVRQFEGQTIRTDPNYQKEKKELRKHPLFSIVTMKICPDFLNEAGYKTPVRQELPPVGAPFKTSGIFGATDYNDTPFHALDGLFSFFA
jgi:hypothetical protein